MTNVNIHLLKGNPFLQSNLKFIEENTKRIIKKISGLICMEDIDIVIMHSPGNIAFGVVSGQTENKYRIDMAVNVKHKNFKKNFFMEAQKILAHSIYHAVRSQKNGYPKKLVEDLLDEGLATYFEMEISKEKVPNYCVSLSKKEMERAVAKAEKNFFSDKYDYDEWVCGSKKKNIPKYTAYAVGYSLIKNYLEKNPKMTASKLISKKYKTFLSEIKLQK